MASANLTCSQLEDRLAALHTVSLELMQDISLESLLERITAIAREQAGARYAAVGVLDDEEGLQHFITLGMSSEQIAQMASPPSGSGLIGALMRSEEPIRLADLRTDPRSAGFPEHHPLMKSFLGVPIRHGKQLLGQIYLTDKIDLPEFSPEDQQVIETLAAYTSIAITNARLYKKLVQRDCLLAQRNENLLRLNELASTLASSNDLDQILDQALSLVMEYLGVEVGEIFLRQGDSRIFSQMLHRGIDEVPALWTGSKFSVGDGALGKVAETGQPILLDVLNQDVAGLHESVLDACFHQIACFPLAGRSGVLGVLCVATRSLNPLADLDLQMLTSISAWIGTAIESVRLEIQSLRVAVLEERERIGMDLHDGIIQSIYAVGLTLEHARLLLSEDGKQARQRIEQAITDLNSTIRDIRAYILDLRPRQLHDENLMQGVRRLVAEFQANTLTEVNLTGPENELAKLPNNEAVALFHICQEGLANIAKHARARHVSVTVWGSNERVLLEVQDDGRGFDIDTAPQTFGHGLANMLTRARNVGGDVEISSEPGNGTTILAWVPSTNEH